MNCTVSKKQNVLCYTCYLLQVVTEGCQCTVQKTITRCSSSA